MFKAKWELFNREPNEAVQAAMEKLKKADQEHGDDIEFMEGLVAQVLSELSDEDAVDLAFAMIASSLGKI